MSVIDEHPAQAHTVLKSLHLEDKLNLIVKERQVQLEKLVQPARDECLEVEVELAIGNTFAEVIRTAQRRQNDLVMKTANSHGVLDRTFFDSTDMHLLRKCPVPLWLINPGGSLSVRLILVSLDPNNEHPVKHRLGMELLKIATSLAEMEGAELLIVHAWQAYEEATLKRYMDEKQFADY
jgi:hypothetical protein